MPDQTSPAIPGLPDLLNHVADGIETDRRIGEAFAAAFNAAPMPHTAEAIGALIRTAVTANGHTIMPEADVDRLTRYREELRDKGNELLDIRGALSPGDRATRPIPPEVDITESALPGVEWLIGRVAELDQAIDKIADRVRPDEDGTWTDQDGILESIGDTIESTGRKVWPEEGLIE